MFGLRRAKADCGCGEESPAEVGHRIPVFPGYGVNPARANGADIEPIPITPVRGQNWPGLQVQLSNGWMWTNYGRRISADLYDRLLTASNSRPGANHTLPGQGRQPMNGPGPLEVKQFVKSTAGAQPRTAYGVGRVMPDLSQRNYYG